MNSDQFTTKMILNLCYVHDIILISESSYNCLRIIGDRSVTCRRSNSRNARKICFLLARTHHFVYDKSHTSRIFTKIGLRNWDESQFRHWLNHLFLFFCIQSFDDCLQPIAASAVTDFYAASVRLVGVRRSAVEVQLQTNYRWSNHKEL